MRGDEVALDTNRAIAVLNDAGDAGQWIQGFARVYVPAPVAGELYFGALKSANAEKNLGRVRHLIDRCEVLPIADAVAQEYGRIRLSLKQRGRPIPENDVWIAAVCVQCGIALATSDGHFADVDGLDLVLRQPPAPPDARKGADPLRGEPSPDHQETGTGGLGGETTP